MENSIELDDNQHWDCLRLSHYLGMKYMEFKFCDCGHCVTNWDQTERRYEDSQRVSAENIWYTSEHRKLNRASTVTQERRVIEDDKHAFEIPISSGWQSKTWNPLRNVEQAVLLSERITNVYGFKVDFNLERGEEVWGVEVMPAEGYEGETRYYENQDFAVALSVCCALVLLPLEDVMEEYTFKIEDDENDFDRSREEAERFFEDINETRLADIRRIRSLRSKRKSFDDDAYPK